MENVQVQPSQVLRRNFLRGVRDALDLLLRDLELEDKGFTFSYIVDFAAVHAYLYKKSDHLFVPIPGESDEQTFARRQMALHILFNSFSHKLILIPPYMEELNNHLHLLQTNSALAAAGILSAFNEPEANSPYQGRLTRLISESKTFADYVRRREKQLKKSKKGDETKPASLFRGEKEEAVNKELQQAAVAIAKDYFPELYTTLSLLPTDTRKNLRALLSGGVLLNSDDEIPECRNVDYFAGKTDEWYSKINKMRGGARAVQSYTDAMACTYIEMANQTLNPRKRIVVFVAPSRTVEAALRSHKMISVDQLTLEPVRDLTYCLLSFIQKNDRAAINENLGRVKRLLEIYESPIPVEWRSKGENATREWNRCENLLLIKDSSMTQLSGAKDMFLLESTFLEILRQLHKAAENKENIRREVEQTLRELHQETIELNQLVPANHTFEALRNIKVQPKGRSVQLVFPALQGELPFPISFTDKNVRRLARNVGELEEDSPSSSIMELRKVILEEAARADATPEHHLLAGYILALEGRYETALADLKQGLVNAHDPERLELLFISAAIHRKLYHPKEACDALEQALDMNKGDLRLNIEYAKALWLRWREDAQRQEKTQDLDKALEHLAQASKALKTDLNKLRQARIESISAYVDKVLRAQIENVSAYIQTELAMNFPSRGAANLREAAAHIKRLEEVLPEGEWIGRFFDTRGYFNYAMAVSLPADRDEKKALLESAAQDLERSLVVDEAAGPDLEVRRGHQGLVHGALVELEAVSATSPS